MSRFRIPKAKITRDSILFTVGLAGICYETVSGGVEKPTLIIAFVGMLGLPLFIRNDEKRRDEIEHDPPPPPPPPARPPGPPGEPPP